jgi:phosphotransacetylase
MEVIRNFEELVSHLSQRTERRRVAVVCPNDHSSQEAVARALDEGIADILIVGADEEAKSFFAKYGERIESVDAPDVDEAATKAVALVREGRADVLMKGLLNTDNLLRAVLNKETGILPKGRVLTHIACAQMPQYDRLLFCTDVAVIPRPTKEQREEQLRYVLELCRTMGVEKPRVALINCSEKVNEKHFPHTVEYRELVAKAEAGEFGPCIVDGPMDLKTSLSEAALKKKHLESPIEGKADALIFPGIQSGNVFYKAITLFCQADTAAILKGPQVPVVLTSRGDSPASKFYSLALACL